MNLEYKSSDCAVKSVGDDGSFELYALAFGNVDRQGDLILPGAVSNADELVSAGWGALNHANSALPVAYANSATQDARGLLVRGQFHSHPEAQAVRTVVRERMAAGKAVPCSIGYVADDASYETRGGEPVRVLKSIRVYEFSFVNLPANPAAAVVSAKGLGGRMDAAEWGVIAAIKQVLGLDTKKGKVLSAANHAALSEHASGMAQAIAGATKAMKVCQQKHAALQAFLDQHDPDADGDDDSSDPGDTDNDKPAKKDIPSPSPADLLKIRILAGRKMTRCP